MKWFSYLLMFVVILLSGTNVWSFERSRTDLNVPTSWETLPVVYYIAKQGSKDIADGSEIEAVKRSFETWQSVNCSRLTFQFGGLLAEPRAFYVPGGPNKNVVMWIENESDWPYPSDVLAVTQLEYNQQTGTILDADILMNGYAFQWSTDEQAKKDTHDVQNVVTHEVGHLLGLDHTSVTEATMFAEAPAEDVSKRALEKDDKDGLCTIYPQDERDQFGFLTVSTELGLASCPSSSQQPTTNNPPERGLGCEVAETSGMMLWLFLALCLIAFRRSVRVLS